MRLVHISATLYQAFSIVFKMTGFLLQLEHYSIYITTADQCLSVWTRKL